MTTAARDSKGFTPLPIDHFTVPERYEGQYSLLVPASTEWVALDFEAVTASQAKLKHLFGPNDDWPPEGLDIATDRSDLQWHDEEFRKRQSFAYHLMNHEARQCLGCLYIYPTASSGHDAEAYLWTRTGLGTHRKDLVENEVIDWVHQQWPFARVAWPGRFIPFREWGKADIPNYYACCRQPGDDQS